MHHEGKGELGKLIGCMKIQSHDPSAAVLENIDRQVSAAMEIVAVKEAVTEKRLEVYGAIYDIGTGKVQVLSRNGIKIEYR